MAANDNDLKFTRPAKILPLKYEGQQYLVMDYRFTSPVIYGESEASNSYNGPKELDLSFKLVYGKDGDQNGQRIKNFEKTSKIPEDIKILTFLCGGPGVANSHASNTKFNDHYLGKGYWILYPDYRGTGDSSSHLIEPNNRDLFFHLRQTDIVRDIESVRRRLLGKSKWTIFGQSFGGWISLTYLSFHSEGLEEVILTGGLAPIQSDPREVYRKLFPRVIEKNNSFYDKYKEAKQKVYSIAIWLAETGGIVTSEERVRPHRDFEGEDCKRNDCAHDVLTAKRFLCIGRFLGKKSSFEKNYDIIKAMAHDIEAGEGLTRNTVQLYKDNDAWRTDKRPLYSIIHDSMYCNQGTSSSNAPQTVADELKDQGDEFWWVNCQEQEMAAQLKHRKERGDTLYLSGEMVYPFFYETYGNLKRFKQIASEIEAHVWKGMLYDLEKLRTNTVRVTAVSYPDDMYVDAELSEKTWNEGFGGKENHQRRISDPKYEHGAIREYTKQILEMIEAKA